MNLSTNILSKFLGTTLATVIFQSAAFADPFIIPGFLGIESSYVETPESDSDFANLYFTLTNLHHEPILILNASGDLFDNSTLKGSNNEDLEYIEVPPRERIVMQSGSTHIQLNKVADTISIGDTIELALLIRRGREAMEYVEEYFDNSLRETYGGGIPNEKEYVMHITVTN